MKYIKAFLLGVCVAVFITLFIVVILALVTMPPYLLVCYTGNQTWWLLGLVDIAVLMGVFASIMKGED